MTRRPPRAVAVGAVCATRIFRVDAIPPPPAKVLASALCELYDGMALSAACAFARLGGQAAIWARTGDDTQGQALRQAVQAEGLDVRALHAVPGTATSQAAVVVDARGERLVVPFHDPQVDASPAWLPLVRLREADIVLADGRWVEGAEAVLLAARAAGVPAMLDAEVGPLAVLQRLVPLASHAVFSDAGLLHYTGLDSVDRALLAVAALDHALAGCRCTELHGPGGATPQAIAAALAWAPLGSDPSQPVGKTVIHPANPG